MAVTRLGSGVKPFGPRIKSAPFQRELHAKVDPIRAIIDRGLIVDSPDIGVEKLPDGRIKLRLKNAIGAPLPSGVAAAVPGPPGPGSQGTFTDFYCGSGGDNLNGGANPGAAIYVSTNGNWNLSTFVFTPTDGTNPVSAGVAVGQFAQVNLDTPTINQNFGRVSAVVNAPNGAITMVNQSVGSGITSGATGRTIRVGGAWLTQVMCGLQNFGNLRDASGNQTRLNMKNDREYTTTTSLNLGSTGAGNPYVIQGYGTTIGDGGRAVWSTATAGVTLLQNPQANNTYADLEFKCTATTGSADLVQTNQGAGFYRCVFHGGQGSGVFSGANNMFYECEAYECNKSNSGQKAGFSTSSTANVYIRCYSHNHNTGSAGANAHGFFPFSSGGHVFLHCIAESCNGSGIAISASTTILISNCDLYNNVGDGVVFNTSGTTVITIENCNFLKNGGKGINVASTSFETGYVFNCGYGAGTMANGGANVLSRLTEASPFTYPADVTPWSAPNTGDFSIPAGSPAAGAGRGAFYETGNSKTGTVGKPNIGAA